MRALTGAISLALAVAACSSSPHATSPVPSTGAAVPCVAQAFPVGALASPSAPESGGYVAVVSKAQPSEQEVTVNPSQSELAVHTSWDTTGDVQLSLFSPSGNDYDRSTHDPAVIHQLFANQESLVIMKPPPGRWRIRLLTGGSGVQVRVDITQIPLSAFAPIAYVVAEPDRGVAPLASQFTVSAQGLSGATITSYRWDFGDCSSFDSAFNPKHVFKLAGSYKVTVTVTDSNGQSGSASKDIFVTTYKHMPIAKFAWGFLDAANPKSLLVDPRPSTDVDGQITSWEWSFGDGTSVSGKDVTHTYLQAGSYPVRLTVTDDGGSSSSTCQLVTTGQFAGTPVACPG